MSEARFILIDIEVLLVRMLQDQVKRKNQRTPQIIPLQNIFFTNDEDSPFFTSCTNAALK